MVAGSYGGFSLTDDQKVAGIVISTWLLKQFSSSLVKIRRCETLSQKAEKAKAISESYRKIDHEVDLRCR